MIAVSKKVRLATFLLGTVAPFASAQAGEINIPAGTLGAALDAYAAQTGIHLLYAEHDVSGVRTKGAAGDLTPDGALARLLSGTGFVIHKHSPNEIAIVKEMESSTLPSIAQIQIAQAIPPRAVETVTVTSSKLGGADVQSIPIAITALSQEQLTATQTAGGPDLIKQVPNMSFTKTNFSGYSIQLRGIGTQAISVTTDPAVAVAFNDVPFIRNHFFEQEFYDLSQAEVLRGPQGTLYGRNATAGVVNLISAKPTDQFEARASADIGNYHNRRFEGMINLPIVDDRFDLRLAGEWTKRQGYSVNALTGNNIDGRDLWSTRVSLSWKPLQNLQTTFVWEHFSEDDDRMRTAKQLCHTDPGPTEVGGVPVPDGGGVQAYNAANYLSQGCSPASLYSNDSFQVPNGNMLPYYEPLSNKGAPITAQDFQFNPYAGTTQSTNLREIETTLDPSYKARNDVLELNADYNVSPVLTVTSQTAFNDDFLWSTEDYNRFNTRPGVFKYQDPLAPDSVNSLYQLQPVPGVGVCEFTSVSGECLGRTQGDACSSPDVGGCQPIGIFCDPQLGCSDRLVAQDLNDEKSWQFSQEFRIASNFTGPFNFSVGGNYLHYETEENYYVFINTLTLAAYSWQKGTSGDKYQTLPWDPGPIPGVVSGLSDNSNCLAGGFSNSNPSIPTYISAGGGKAGYWECMYIDPNPISSLNNKGHNYFLSQNPYVLNSYAGFGEAYYNVFSDLKLTGGLRWTDDRKHFVDIPSELLVAGYGYPITGVVDQSWGEFTGRFAANWTPKLDFTDQTLVYGSYSHGYKAGGANPPGAILLTFQGGDISDPIHPLTFKPEFIDAFEIGTKNTLLDGALTLNGNLFFYNYKDYQISRIVDRTAINDNFDATVRGAEIEATYEPLPGLRFNFAGGYERTRIANGQSSIDLIDRADVAGHPGWMVVKPFATQASNCVLPVYVVAALLRLGSNHDYGVNSACSYAYSEHVDPVTLIPYEANPTEYCTQDVQGGYSCQPLPMPAPYAGFDPLAGTTGHPYTGQNTSDGVDYGHAPNNGEGFAKDLSGNELPNAPPFTVSFSADYTIPVTSDWAATVHGDYYWQDYSWARVFNDNPYDRLRGYTNVNLALILTSQDGWQVMGYVKNIFDVTDITGTFLNSDDSGLTTNVFLTDPRLFGVRVTKNW